MSFSLLQLKWILPLSLLYIILSPFCLQKMSDILSPNLKTFRMKPRLENPSFKPAKCHIIAALQNFVDILKIRYSSPLFRLTTASDIEVHAFFVNLTRLLYCYHVDEHFFLARHNHIPPFCKFWFVRQVKSTDFMYHGAILRNGTQIDIHPAVGNELVPEN